MRCPCLSSPVTVRGCRLSTACSLSESSEDPRLLRQQAMRLQPVHRCGIILDTTRTPRAPTCGDGGLASVQGCEAVHSNPPPTPEGSSDKSGQHINRCFDSEECRVPCSKLQEMGTVLKRHPTTCHAPIWLHLLCVLPPRACRLETPCIHPQSNSSVIFSGLI